MLWERGLEQGRGGPAARRDRECHPRHGCCHSVEGLPTGGEDPSGCRAQEMGGLKRTENKENEHPQPGSSRGAAGKERGGGENTGGDQPSPSPAWSAWAQTSAPPAWVLAGPTAGLSLWEEVMARGLLFPQPLLCHVPAPCGEAEAQERPGHGSGNWGPEVLGVAVSLRARPWLELSASSGVWPPLQPRQPWWWQPKLGATAM